MRRALALMVVMLMVVMLTAACGNASVSSPEPAVSAAEATDLVNQVARESAQRTPESVAHICTSLADGCFGLSSEWRADPTSAPQSLPSVLCDIELPATAQQSGARVLVLTGQDAARRSYAGQALVQRRGGHLVLHEPAFWEGILYTQLARGRAWHGASGSPQKRAKHYASVRRTCSHKAAFVAAVTAMNRTRPTVGST